MKKLLFILFISTSIFGQINFSRISFDLGYVRNYQSNGTRLHSFSPEIKIGGNFFADVLEWEIHTSYWNDGIENKFDNISDYTTFSYSNITVGSKIYFVPSKLKFHMLLNGGLSYRYVFGEYIGGSYSRISYDDNIFHVLSLDLGVGFRYNINSDFRIRTELNAFIALNQWENQFEELNNYELKSGIDYFIH